MNPVTWLGNYLGTYAQSGGVLRVSDESSNETEFTPTSVKIEAIPEPTTASLLALVGAIGFMVRRHFLS